MWAPGPGVLLWGAGARAVQGDFLGGSWPAVVPVVWVTGGLLYPVRWGVGGVGLGFLPVRPESGESDVSCVQVVDGGFWVHLSCEVGQRSRTSRELCLRLCGCDGLYPSVSCEA